MFFASGCTGGDTPSPPAAAVGHTDQDQRVVVGRVDNDHVTLKWAARCTDVPLQRNARRAPTVFSPNDGRERLLELTRHGDRYTGRGRWREDFTDGDYELVTATVTARVADDGRRITGTLTAGWKAWNGEGHGFDATCASGTVTWTADRATPERAATPAGDLVGWTTGDATTTDGHTVWTLLRPTGVDSTAPYRLATIDATTGDVTSARTIDIRRSSSGGEPSMTFVEGSLWISREDYGPTATCLIDVVDPARATTTRTLPICVRHLAATPDGHVWASSFVRDVGPRVFVIDAGIGKVVDQLDVGDPTAVSGAGSRVWIKASNDRLKAIDATTHAVVATFDFATYPRIAATPDGGAWVTDTSFTASGAWRVAPDGAVREVDLPAPAESVAATPDGGAWFTSTLDLTARRVDGSGRVTRTVDLPTRAWWALATADGDLVAVTDHGVVRVDDA